MTKFQRGDVARLKSGSPELLVLRVDGSDVTCGWVRNSCTRMIWTFEAVTLKAVERDPMRWN